MLIKVCGMRVPENIKRVASLPIDWMGFVCYPLSPRAISPETSASSLRLPEGCPIQKVGVFVDAPIAQIEKACRRYGFSTCQLHGSESPTDCLALREKGYRVVKAFPVARETDLFAIEPYVHKADFFLFDTRCEGYGGSGRAFDWNLLARYEGPTPFLLSGGLRPDSLPALLEFHHPAWAGIDLNSGFELSPGIKDIRALEQFVKQFKNQKHE